MASTTQAVPLLLVLIGALGSAAGPARADGLAELANTVWSGSGQVRFAEGRSEAMRCKAFYTRRDDGLGIAIRCASQGQSIDLRANLVAAGSRLSGSWEERSFNASGQATGTVTGGRLALTIDGGGLKAGVTVTTSGASQTVAITSEGTRLRGFSIALARETAPR
jgi:hypothetical protein